MAIQSKTIRITKFNAARLQLNTAIALWFQDSDAVSVLTLAHASHEILHRLYKNAGHGNLLFDTAHIPKSKRDDFVKKLKFAPNFLKHANRSGEEEGGAQFSTATSVTYMFFSLLAVNTLVGKVASKLSAEEQAFLAYCLIHQPDWFPEHELKNGASADLAQLRPIKSAQFLEMFVKTLGSRHFEGLRPPTHD